ncbi:hypothetical protein [Reichenbachiella sp.]|uniref:hypothetical protein n=1 Tax=Reichenbachiella sp. TaxID=2184521 RepID=UPI003297A4A4
MVVKKIKAWIHNRLFGSKLQKHVQVFNNPKAVNCGSGIHLPTRNNLNKGLKNLFTLAHYKVVFMENLFKFGFKEIIEKLYKVGEIDWLNLFYHYMPESIKQKPHLMICSKTKLDYSELSDYNILLKN